MSKRVSLSELMLAALLYAQAEGYSHEQCEHEMHFLLGSLGRKEADLFLPQAFHWEEATNPVPADVLNQFVGQKAEAGILIVIDGHKYMALDTYFDEGAKIVIGSVFEHPPPVEALTLVDLDLVDFEA